MTTTKRRHRARDGESGGCDYPWGQWQPVAEAAGGCWLVHRGGRSGGVTWRCARGGGERRRSAERGRKKGERGWEIEGNRAPRGEGQWGRPAASAGDKGSEAIRTVADDRRQRSDTGSRFHTHGGGTSREKGRLVWRDVSAGARLEDARQQSSSHTAAAVTAAVVVGARGYRRAAAPGDDLSPHRWPWCCRCEQRRAGRGEGVAKRGRRGGNQKGTEVQRRVPRWPSPRPPPVTITSRTRGERRTGEDAVRHVRNARPPTLGRRGGEAADLRGRLPTDGVKTKGPGGDAPPSG